MIRAEGCDPSRITLEMTESATMAPRPGLEEEMDALSAHGIRWPSTTSGPATRRSRRLGEFPAGMLKIDRSFVRGLPEAARRARS